MAYVVYKANKIDLDKDISIGRDKSKNELVIEEGTVSRSHAIIKQIGDKFYIIDLGSSNGTYKDSKRVQSPVLLENKSVIQCGNTQILFYDDEDDEDDDETLLAFSSNFVVEAIVLVADIKGYTTFSQQASIQVVSKIMSAWLRDVNSVIVGTNGYVDSFIGDCVYARWDNMADKDTALNVLNVAKKISEITKRVSKEISKGEFELDICSGVHTGEVVVGAATGNTGLGDTINTTFRLEGSTRALKVDMVMSKEFHDLAGLNQDIIEIELKGKGKFKSSTMNYEDI